MDLGEIHKLRELVAKHLAWLDAQIAEAHSVRTENPVPSTKDDRLQQEQEVEHRSSPSTITLGQKAGCIAFLAFVLVVFLALLFVLPLFIYK